jgi:hypothetical protein
MQLAASACKNWMQLAASRIQIVPAWPPVACELYPRGRQLHANCTRVAASRMQHE